MSAVQSTHTALERERLILEHLPQVRWIAANIHERLPASVAQEDLVSTGILGLIQAVDNFDPGRNASMRTYAEFRIRGAILDSLRGLDGIQPHKRKRVRQVQDAISALEAKHGRTATEDEIAAELGISSSEYQVWLTDLRGVSLGSLDSLHSETADNNLLSYLADPKQEDPAAIFERKELKALLVSGIAVLPRTEQIVLDLYFREELTLAEIARVLGVHLSRVSQIKVQSVLRLRSYLEAKLKARRTGRTTD